MEIALIAVLVSTTSFGAVLLAADSRSVEAAGVENGAFVLVAETRAGSGVARQQCDSLSRLPSVLWSGSLQELGVADLGPIASTTSTAIAVSGHFLTPWRRTAGEVALPSSVALPLGIGHFTESVLPMTVANELTVSNRSVTTVDDSPIPSFLSGRWTSALLIPAWNTTAQVCVASSQPEDVDNVERAMAGVFVFGAEDPVVRRVTENQATFSTAPADRASAIAGAISSSVLILMGLQYRRDVLILQSCSSSRNQLVFQAIRQLVALSASAVFVAIAGVGFWALTIDVALIGSYARSASLTFLIAYAAVLPSALLVGGLGRSDLLRG